MNSRHFKNVAAGTMLSRATGFLRVIVMAWVLGFTPLADAFNLANTVPNMVFDLVLGGIMSATFIPVFVERLTHDTERRAYRSISVVVTMAIVILAAATFLAVIAAPLIIDSFTVFSHDTTVMSQQQHDVAVALLRWFAPQIFFYGLFGILGALLNIKDRFTTGAFAPTLNNVVCIAVLLWFHLIDPVPRLGHLTGGSHVMTLGLGTSLGVAVQCLVMWPALRRAGLGPIRFRLDRHDPALRAISRLGMWTMGVVVTNQLSLYVVLAVAFSLGGDGPVSAYTYGWTFMQVPFAVVVTSLLSTLTPTLSSHAASRNDVAFTRRLEVAVRQCLVVIIPVSFLLIVVAQPLLGLTLHHADATTHLPAATVLAVLAAGLPGFTVFQVCVRGLQARQKGRDVFYLYAVENALTIALALTIGKTSLGGLTASVSLAYTASAFVAVLALSRDGVSIGPIIGSIHVRRAVLAGVAASLCAAIMDATFTAGQGAGLFVRLLLDGGSAVAGFGVASLYGQRRAAPRP